jgi:hypothetical protein
MLLRPRLAICKNSVKYRTNRLFGRGQNGSMPAKSLRKKCAGNGHFPNKHRNYRCDKFFTLGLALPKIAKNQGFWAGSPHAGINATI